MESPSNKNAFTFNSPLKAKRISVPAQPQVITDMELEVQKELEEFKQSFFDAKEGRNLIDLDDLLNEA